MLIFLSLRSGQQSKPKLYYYVSVPFSILIDRSEPIGISVSASFSVLINKPEPIDITGSALFSILVNKPKGIDERLDSCTAQNPDPALSVAARAKIVAAAIL